MKTLKQATGIVALAVATIAFTALLEAHMKVEKTVPAAGAAVKALPTVSVDFSEPPDLKISKMEIKGPSDKTKLTGMHVMGKSLMAMVEGDKPDGSYTVSWQSAGDDGHVQKGDFTFSVTH